MVCQWRRRCSIFVHCIIASFYLKDKSGGLDTDAMSRRRQSINTEKVNLTKLFSLFAD